MQCSQRNDGPDTPPSRRIVRPLAGIIAYLRPACLISAMLIGGCMSEFPGVSELEPVSGGETVESLPELGQGTTNPQSESPAESSTDNDNTNTEASEPNAPSMPRSASVPPAMVPQSSDRMRPIGQPDSFTYHGICAVELTTDDGVLSNDDLEMDVRASLTEQENGFKVIVGGPDASYFSVRPDGYMRFSAPSERVGQTFTASYTIVTPWGASAPIDLMMKPPPNQLVVSPLAPDNIHDDGRCSLREAIHLVGQVSDIRDCGTITEGPATVVFDDTGEIRLNDVPMDTQNPLGQLPQHGIIVDGQVHVMGCGTSSHIVNAQARGRIFNVRKTGHLTVERMSLRMGRSSIGGAVMNAGVVKLMHIEAVSNQAIGSPGADSACTPSGGGGGALAAGGFLAMVDNAETTIEGSAMSCRIQQNTAEGGQGGAQNTGLCTSGGAGGGFRGGNGGDGGALQSRAWSGGAGGFGSGGGGGGGSTLRATVDAAMNNGRPSGGAGGRGGWGGGGGGAALGEGVSPGPGGFAGGMGLSRQSRPGSGGGGAALGGAIVLFGGRLNVNGCTFNGNAALGGAGGRVLGEALGETGRNYGADIFRVNGIVDVDDEAGIRIEHCNDASDQPAADCRPWSQLVADD